MVSPVDVFFTNISLKPGMQVFSVLSHVQLFTAPWTVAYQTPLSMEFPRQECWCGLLFPSPGNNPGIEPVSPVLAGDSLPLSHQGNPYVGLVPSF